MNRIFQIGNFCFRLCCPDEVTVPPNFMGFAVEAGEPEYTYEIKIEDHFPQAEGRMLARRPDLLVYEVPAGESRYIGIKGVEGYYAYYEEQFKNCAKVILNPERLQGLNIDPVFTSLLALERKMIYRDSLILHCAYVRYQGEAILFSAPSETGKTTQANLWEKYRGSQTINGDRALIRKEDGRWTAGGWPVCGTSDVCYNLSTPIRAVVMLSQAEEDRVHRLKPSEAFMLLFSQITVNRWNRESAARTLDLTEELIGQVPVLHLDCTISENAVDCLEKVLYGETEDLR